jgi:hypothetical protein
VGRLLNGSERRLFDSIAMDVLRLAGADQTVLWKFVRNPAKTINQVSGFIDCLYEEPINASKHYFPYKIMCYFDQPDRATEATDDGRQQRSEGRAWVSRKDLEEKKVPLDETGNHMASGDIIQLFSKSGKTWYFEVMSVNRDGFENDSDVWTHYVLDLVRNDSFIPERKIF